MKIYKHEVKFNISQKALSEDKKDFVVSGYASIFGNTDSYYDVLMPGAFKDCLNKKVPIFLNHKPDQHIGYSEKLSEDRKGLKIEFSLFNDNSVPEAEKAAFLIDKSLEKKVPMGLSIGGYPSEIEKEMVEKDGEQRIIYKIKKWDLIEVSVTPVPANDEARTTNIKSLLRDIGEKDKAPSYLDRNTELIKKNIASLSQFKDSVSRLRLNLNKGAENE